jgi:hypothetical protein
VGRDIEGRLDTQAYFFVEREKILAFFLSLLAKHLTVSLPIGFFQSHVDDYRMPKSKMTRQNDSTRQGRAKARTIQNKAKNSKVEGLLCG